MRLFLHIGTHKTGTTAVQHFLTANRQKLPEQGVLYPLAGSPPRDSISHGQHALAWAVTRPAARQSSSPPRSGGQATPDLARAWGDLREELAAFDGDLAVISSEEFDVVRDDDQFEALRANLEGLDVRIVVYLRRQDEFLHSYYCTDVLFHREARDFHEYRGTLKTQADYRALLSGWEQAFGREALTVRTYEKPRLRDGDIVADLCGEVGIDMGVGLSRPQRQGQVNRAYPRNVIRSVLWARQAGMKEDDINTLRGLFHLVYRNSSSAADYLSPSDRLALLADYEDSNHAVARRYLDRDSLFEDLDVGRVDEWSKRYAGEFADLSASIEDAREVLAGLRRPRTARDRPFGGGPAPRTGSGTNGASVAEGAIEQSSREPEAS